jgi:hypothetical protein
MQACVAMILLAVTTASAPSNTCGQMFCFDLCSNQEVLVNGNTCGQAWDPTRGCFRADGTCGPGGTTCGTTQCFDLCTRSYVSVEGNACSQAWDTSHGCWRADGTCQ